LEQAPRTGTGALDVNYCETGAEIASTPDEIFATADLIIKVKEPQPSEWVQLREGQILFTYPHRVRTRFSIERAIEEEIVDADVVIGAVLLAGANTRSGSHSWSTARFPAGSSKCLRSVARCC
jgi:alanine dehydrogenase